MRLAEFYKWLDMASWIVIPAIIWLYKPDAEATFGGLTLSMYGFCASCIAGLLRFDYEHGHMKYWYFPWSPVILGAIVTVRIAALWCFSVDNMSQTSRYSRLAIVILWVVAVVLVPAFVETVMTRNRDLKWMNRDDSYDNWLS